MSWHFSRELVEAYSADTCSGGGVSAQLNSMTTPDGSLWLGKTTDACRLSRYGTTLELLTVDHGEELLTSYLAGFPVQDISCAGKGAGLEGERSGLWVEMARIIREVQPRFALVENSPMLTSRGLGRVLGDLAEMGYDARWGVVSAENAGALHKRERIWVMAYTAEARRETRGTYGMGKAQHVGRETNTPSHFHRLQSSPESFRDADGVANRLDRLARIGNGQVPSVVRLAWRLLNQ